MSETEILKKTLATLCKEYAGRGLFYRRNTGAMETASGFVRFGVPGMADIGGIIDGKAIEIEVKSERGTQSEPQKKWQMAVERVGGIYITTRSAKDCLEQVKNRLG